MSGIRIMIGVLVSSIFLAGELAAVWFYNLSVMWVPITLFVLVAIVGGAITEFETQKRLRVYWDRACMGFRWKRRFPDTPTSEIREFLHLFGDAFLIQRKRRCCFSPDDHVMQVYWAFYPPGTLADSCELEDFCARLQRRYSFNLEKSWREDITLGEIYERVHRLTPG
jgi:hypothetical protein